MPSGASVSAGQTAGNDWQKEWFAIEDAAYLNTAAQAAMPRVSLDAVQVSLAAKRFPHHLDDAVWFEVTNRLRASLASLIGARSDEIALTTGASTGLAAVANGVTWKPGDEIITAKGEFPLHYATWKPMEEREGAILTIVTPRDRFIAADDLIAAMTPRTRVMSVSLVRFDDGSLLDAARVAAACHEQGAIFVLDATQACGAVPIDVSALGADFLVCSGYKWLLSPYGTGFFWAKSERQSVLRPGPFYWQAQAADTFASLNLVDPTPARSARRWDAPETASYFNFNVTAMDASVGFVHRVGPAAVLEHNRALIASLFDNLPKGCSPASPLDPAQRGPYGCFVGRNREETIELYQKLLKQNVFVSLREGRIRVSPHLFNSTQDIDRLVSVIAA